MSDVPQSALDRLRDFKPEEMDHPSVRVCRAAILELADAMRQPDYQTPSNQNRLGPREGRAMERAKTYVGVARAMAHQWGSPNDQAIEDCDPVPKGGAD